MSMLSNSEALTRASHELRTPLTAILGFGELLALGQLDEAQRHNVEQILAGGRHLLALIEDLLELSRVGADKLELELDAVDAGEEIRRAVALCAPLAAERSLTVTVEVGEEPPIIQADRTRLQQVLLNLISNAIKYNRAGGTVTVRAWRDAEDGGRIAVIDTGRGMTKTQLARLFVPFERLGAPRGIEGHGLGLVVSKGLTEAMGGAIEVASTPLAGSVFTLRLPSPQTVADRREPALAGVA
jgi:signal transduction histidine kinase